MFTGIIEGVGRISARDAIGGDALLTIEVGSLPFDAVALGESIAVNGTCLTVIDFDARTITAGAPWAQDLPCTPRYGPVS